MTGAEASSVISRAILRGPAIWLAIRISPIPARSHYFGFPQLGAGHADRAGRDLHFGDLDHLLSLDVRPPMNLVVAADVGNTFDVLFEKIEIHE